MNLHCTMVREVSDGATSQVVSVNAEMTQWYCRLDIGSDEHYVRGKGWKPYATTSENTHFSWKI